MIYVEEASKAAQLNSRFDSDVAFAAAQDLENNDVGFVKHSRSRRSGTSNPQPRCSERLQFTDDFIIAER